jgi:hypothetical protein
VKNGCPVPTKIDKKVSCTGQGTIHLAYFFTAFIGALAFDGRVERWAKTDVYLTS